MEIKKNMQKEKETNDTKNQIKMRKNPDNYMKYSVEIQEAS